MKAQHYDKMRRASQPWRAWYSTKDWHRIRGRQLKVEPYCRMCAEARVETPATTVDHIKPHRGDRYLFFAGPFQSLCTRCHNSIKQRAEKIGYSSAVGEDGMPVDRTHPFYR